MEESYQNLTKRQRRELRRKEQEEERKNAVKKSQVKKIIWGLIFIGVVGGLIFLLRNSGGGEPLAEDNTDPQKGNLEAKVVIKEYSDFQCPACAAAQPILKQVLDEYGDKVKLVFNDFPLSIHKEAKGAAYAAECANEQGKFWEYHDTLFEKQNTWSEKSEANELFKNYAKDLGLDTDKFNQCFSEERYKDRTQKDLDEGRAQKVSATPTFFINGERLVGAKPLKEFKKVIDSKLNSS